MKIYTKNGDKGTTSLCGGHRVAKDDLRVEAYGTIDELNAHLGLLISFLNQDRNLHFTSLIHPLEHLQENLFMIGSVLSSYTETDQTQPVIAKCISEMEDSIDSWTAEIPPQSSFILPGGTVSAAQCHVCRTVCRPCRKTDYLIISSCFAISRYLILYEQVVRLLLCFVTLFKHKGEMSVKKDGKILANKK